jgi:signal transduction histidine kinase/DNA-binding response OmpR family regulator
MLNNLSIRQKLYTISLIPLVVFFYLTATIINNENDKKSQMEKILQIIDISTVALALSDSLQNERGYSMCFTKTKGKELLEEKNNQRIITDKYIKNLLNIKYLNLLNQNELTNIKEEIKKIQTIRHKVDKLKVSPAYIRNSYGILIKTLMSLIQNINTNNANISVFVDLIDEISNAKNESSLERTILNSVILTKKFNIDSLSEMIYSSSKQIHHLESYSSIAFGNLQDFYFKSSTDESFFEVIKIRKEAKKAISESINREVALSITSNEWCNIASKKLIILRQIEEKTIEEFKKVVKKEYSNIQQDFYKFLFILFLIVILSTFTVRKVVEDINTSLKNLGFGLESFFDFLNFREDKTILIEIKGKDEIADMSYAINNNMEVIKNNLSKDMLIIESLSQVILNIQNEDFNIEQISLETSNPILKELQSNINELLVILKNKSIELKDYKDNLEEIIIMKTHELEKLNRSLEDKVADATSEIIKSNKVLEDEKNRLANFTNFLSTLNTVDISYLCNGTLKHLVKVSSSIFGLMYLKQDDKLKLISTSTIDEEHLRVNISTLEKLGAINDALKNNKWISIEDIDSNSLVSLDIGIAKLKFSSLYIIPLYFQNKELGVIVLASHSKIDKNNIEGYKKALENSLNNAVSYNLIQKQRVSLESANMELLRADKLKSEFLANMSHELRTPLNSVIGFSSILIKNKKGNLDNKQIGQIDKINKNGNHLLGLINDILDLSKIEAGKIEIDPIKVDIINIVKNTIDMLQGQAHNKNIRLFFTNKSSYENLTVELDDNKFRQVLVNLVGNALKFVDSGTGIVSVELNIKDEKVCIEVIDNGIGIESDKLDLIFEAFRQADGSTTRNYGGTGLGLTISKSIIELLGGNITVDSKIGEGSIFSIFLPIDLKENNIKKDNNPNEILIPKVNKMDIKNILIVDDTNDSREIIKEYLKDLENIELFFANDGKEAFERAKSINPSLIITDIMMPKVNGWELLDMIKADKQLQNTPVIIVSNVVNEAKALSLGAIDCLNKPISRDDLIATFKKNFKGIEESILIVDDEEDIRDMLKDILSDKVKTIKTAINGENALDILEHGFYPDLIYLDLMMPTMDGFKFLEIVKHHEKYKFIPIVVISAKDLSLEEKTKLNNLNVKVIAKGKDISNEVKEVLQLQSI